MMLGFTTGLGAPVRVSAAGIKAAAALLAEADEERTAADECRSSPVEPETVPLPGFSTGLGAAVHISRTGMQAAKKLLAESLAGESDPAPVVESSPIDRPSTSFGFTNGLGAAIYVSAAGIKAASKLFDDENDDDAPEPAEPVPAEITPPPDTAVMPGFTTGLGAPVSISAAKLAAAKGLLDDCPEDPSISHPEPAGEPASPVKQPTQDQEAKPKAAAPMVGFSTGLGTPVSVSASRLAAARLLLKDEEGGAADAPEEETRPALQTPVATLRGPSRLGPPQQPGSVPHAPTANAAPGVSPASGRAMRQPFSAPVSR